MPNGKTQFPKMPYRSDLSICAEVASVVVARFFGCDLWRVFAN